MMPSRFVSKMGAICVLVAMVSAEDQQASAPADVPPSGVSFSTRTELVTVPVVVIGKKGKHLTGLKQSDFTLEESGHKRDIATFEEVTAGDSPKKSEERPAFSLSNFASSGKESSLVTILVVDLLNTPFLAQANARGQLLKFLNAHLSGAGPTELTVITSSGLHLVHSFTTDPSILIEAMKRIKPDALAPDQAAPIELIDLSPDSSSHESLESVSEPTQLAQNEATNLRQFLAEKPDAYYAYYRRHEATLITLKALEQLAQSANGIPGRKSLIWLTGGLSMLLNDPANLAHFDISLRGRYQDAWQKLNDANVSVYPIDARGLYPPEIELPPAGPFSPASTFGPRSNRRDVPSQFPVSAMENLQDSLKSFAQATGGEACYNRNDLDKCVGLAALDSSQYYMLGYYLPRDDRKPGWRKFKVRVAPAHKEIRARNAVYVGEPKVGEAHSIQQQFENAFSSPVNYTAVPLGLKFTSPTEGSGANRKIGFSVFLQPNGFATENNWIKLNVQVVATDRRQRSHLVFSKMFHAHLKPDAVDDLMKNGFQYNGDIALSPGRYQLKLLVRDDLDGKLGTIDAPLLVK